MPSEREVAAADAIPEGIVRQIKALGPFGLSIPESFGGAGLTMGQIQQLIIARNMIRHARST